MTSGKILARTARWQKADLKCVLARICQGESLVLRRRTGKDAIERLS